MAKTLLHVGCGGSTIANLPFYQKDGGWDEIRYDINEAVSPDIVGTLQDMSIIENGSMDSVFSSHNIEHVHSFEVGNVVRQFRRVLRSDGFAIILCPDIVSVAQAIVAGNITNPLYISPAGPISAIDILYGFQQDIRGGNVFMAHKTAFSAETLGKELLTAGFDGGVVARDTIFGLHAIATPSKLPKEQIDVLLEGFFPPQGNRIEVLQFGCYAI